MKSKILVTVVALFAFLQASAFVSYERTNPLADGNWVKISVQENGIHELSYDDLRKMGFQNPENIKIFGQGGFAESESLSKGYDDDLEQNAIFHHGNKVYFYAKGAVKDSLYLSSSSKALIPIQNNYSQLGYYFITDNSAYTAKKVEDLSSVTIAENAQRLDVGLTAWYQNEDLYNPALTGGRFLGDDYLSIGKQKTYDIRVPLFSNQGFVTVASNFAMFGNQTMSVNVMLNGNGNVLHDITNNLYANTYIEQLEYSLLPIRCWMPASNFQNGIDQISLKLQVSIANGVLSRCWEDYVSLTYFAQNTIPADSAQTVRYFELNKNNIINSKLGASQKMWLVEEYGCARNKNFAVKNCVNVPQADGTVDFAYGKNSRWGKFIYFDLNKAQKHPKFEGKVANQNLHGLATPNMVIITNDELRPAAERLAEFNRNVRGMEVLVLDQNLIFNEFSSGARSAMAYRSLCNMFYHRDSNKFKYLLLMGTGSYDNRMLYADENSFEALMTYQTEDASSQVSSYMSDDFFGFLEDTDNPLRNQDMSISVGRLPFSSLKDADIYVDKVIRYLSQPNDETSSWKNNVFVIGEVGDNNAHLIQSESFVQNLRSSKSFDVNISKLYTQAYSDINETRNRFVELLNCGQNFGLFIGHSNPISLTKSMVLLNMVQSEMTHYPVMPFMYFSSCDVSRFDNGSPNFLSKLLLNPNGGIIAGIAAARPVYINMNGNLSNYFGISLVKDEAYYKGDKSIGRILVDAKNNLNENSFNHMKYFVIGDPSLPLNLPKNQVFISAINGTTIKPHDTMVKVGLGEKVALQGLIKDVDGTNLGDFNGSVSIKIFEPDYKYTQAQLRNPETGKLENTDLYDRGKELMEINASVVNGSFDAELIVPPFVSSTSGKLVLRMFAVDNNGYICSGSNDSMTIDMTRNVVGDDVTDPVIETMYINSPEFADGDVVGSDFTVFANLSDDSGILSSSESLLISTMKLIIDNGKTTVPVKNYYSTSSNSGYVEVPVYSMKEGKHTVELTVSDIYGNIARKTLSYIVENTKPIYKIEVLEKALVNMATIMVDKENGSVDNAEIFVTDDANNVYFQSPITSFPFEWNLNDNKGNRLSPGIYNVYGVVDGIGTPIKKIAVLKQ